MTVLVALIGLCAANLAMIWQVTTLIGKVDDVQAMVRWLARMEAWRQKNGATGDDD